MTEDNITDEELEKLFRGSDLLFAVQMLDSCRREHMWRFILSKCRYFDEDDLHDVYTQALHEFIICVKKPEFDPQAPLKLFLHIANRRAIDRARKKKGSRLKENTSLIEPLYEDLKGTSINVECKLICDEEKSAFRKALDKAVDDLAPKQRIAALAMLEVYDQVRSDESPKALAVRIREMTNEDCTASQAADRWEAARENLSAALSKAGFRKLYEVLK